MSNGKGDRPRPLSVTPDAYAANFARIKWTEEPDSREVMRQRHLAEAKHVIDSAPPYVLPCTDTPTEPHD